MSSLKVLPLDPWALSEHKAHLETALSYRKPIQPAFNRPGRYMLRKYAWIELPDGRAFLEDALLFKYDLAILDAERLTSRQIAVLKQMVVEGLASKKQRDLLGLALQARSLRESGRRAALHHKRALGRIRKIKGGEE